MYENAGIYQLINTVNNKSYVGQAVDTRKRIRDHFYNVRVKNGKANILFQRSYDKYGSEAFVSKILETISNDCSVEELRQKLTEREDYWMKQLKPEYNLAPAAGSNLGIKMPQGFGEKVSASLKKLWEEKPHYNLGNTATEETRAKMSKSSPAHIKYPDDYWIAYHKEHLSGKSVKQLSKETPHNRQTFYDNWKRLGLPSRSKSEAETIKWAQMSDEQRAHQVKAAHDAARKP